MGYYITSAICLGLLVGIPFWSTRTDQPQFPFAVILLLAVIVVVVPMMVRTSSPRRRKGD